MSLKDDIHSSLKKVRISFHMPGHKYNDIVDMNLAEFDTTEISGTDNLHSAFFCIKNSEERIAEIYQSKRSRLMVAGSSIGLIASIYALSEPNDTILIGRDSHKSVFNASKIAAVSVITLSPDLSSDNTPSSYRGFYDCLMEHPEVKLAVITSPTYHGYIRIFQKIADELHRRGGYLIVDEAHGAHLNFTKLSDYQALRQGADVVVQSAHKTLPSMTMSAVLHYGDCINDEAMERVDEALKMFQSSSPSYPLMISIDSGVSYMEKHREVMREKFDLFKRLGEELFGKEAEDLRDPFKIYLNTAKLGYTGYEVHEIMMKKGIYAEFSDYNGILLYLSIFNTEEELREVYEILTSLKARKEICLKDFKYNRGKTIINRSRKKESKYEIIDLENALNRVAMEDIVPYPPGIPILLEGEVISEEVLTSLKALKNLPAGVLEGRDGCLEKIKVLSYDLT